MGTSKLSMLGMGLLSLTIGCSGAAPGQEHQRGTVVVDPTLACEAAGGSCAAIEPGSCGGGEWGDPALCGNGVGVGCCLPPSAACQPLPNSTGDFANPASVYCVQLGYAWSDGQCSFPDGTACEEWSFFRGQCGQAHSFCNLHGGTVSTVNGINTALAVCTMPDGKECTEDTYAHSCVCG